MDILFIIVLMLVSSTCDALSTSNQMINKNSAYLEPRLPIPYLVQQQQPRLVVASEPDKESEWDILKDTVYNFSDECSSALAVVFRTKDKSNGISGNRPIQGYKDSVETPAVLSLQQPLTPGARIMIQQQLEGLHQQQEEEPRGIKDVFYNAVDAIFDASLNNKSAKSNGIIVSTPKTVIKPSLQSFFTSTSTNDATSLASRKKQRRIGEAKLEEQFLMLKDFIYRLVDLTTTAKEEIAAAPMVLQQTAATVQQKVESTSSAVRSGVQTLQDVPDNLRKSLQDAQNSINEAKQDAQKSINEAAQIAEVVIQDVQSIPEEVGKKIKDIQGIPDEVRKKIKDAERLVTQFQQDATALNQKVKVLTGLEPPPPPPPPPPPIEEEVGKITPSGVAISGVKASWWMLKTVLGLGAQSVKAAWKYSMKKQNESNNQSSTVSSQALTEQERKQILMLEVDEALLLAKEAIGETYSKPSLSDKNVDTVLFSDNGPKSLDIGLAEKNPSITDDGSKAGNTIIYSDPTSLGLGEAVNTPPISGGRAMSLGISSIEPITSGTSANNFNKFPNFYTKLKKALDGKKRSSASMISLDEALLRATESAATAKRISAEVESILTDEKP
jgi:uncharacterized protein (UPF0147 family)